MLLSHMVETMLLIFLRRSPSSWRAYTNYSKGNSSSLLLIYIVSISSSGKKLLAVAIAYVSFCMNYADGMVIKIIPVGWLVIISYPIIWWSLCWFLLGLILFRLSFIVADYFPVWGACTLSRGCLYIYLLLLCEFAAVYVIDILKTIDILKEVFFPESEVLLGSGGV